MKKRRREAVQMTAHQKSLGFIQKQLGFKFGGSKENSKKSWGLKNTSKN